MKKHIKSLLAIALFTLITSAAWAQPGFDDDVNDVPLDGGITLLIGAGVAMGAKALYKQRKDA